jgi:hypothetical protein
MTTSEWRHPAYWWRLGISLICAALSLWAILRLTVRSLSRQVIWTDYALFRATVNRWIEGVPMYGSGIPIIGAPRATESVNFNPPQFHLLVLPFANLELWPGLQVWLVLSLLAGCVCAAIVIRTLRLHWSLTPAMMTAAVLLNSAALSSTLWFGQISLFLALPVTLAWRALRLGQWNAVGAWMGLAASIKPFLLIVFPYLLLKRQWRAAVWGAVAWAASFGLGVAVFGPSALMQWLDAARWPTWRAHFHNASFQAYVSRVMWEWPGDHVASIGSAAGILATLWVAYKRDLDAAWAMLMTGAILWAPLGWVYYEWFLVPPLAVLIAERRLPRAAWLLVVPFVWPITGYPVRITGTLLDAQIRSIYFWGLLGLWLLLCSSGLSSRRTERTEVRTDLRSLRILRRSQPTISDRISSCSTGTIGSSSRAVPPP